MKILGRESLPSDRWILGLLDSDYDSWVIGFLDCWGPGFLALDCYHHDLGNQFRLTRAPGAAAPGAAALMRPHGCGRINAAALIQCGRVDAAAPGAKAISIYHMMCGRAKAAE
jgi:hypothetical protein